MKADPCRSGSTALLECMIGGGVSSGWMERMAEDGAVLPYRLHTNTHAAFLSTMLTGHKHR